MNCATNTPMKWCPLARRPRPTCAASPTKARDAAGRRAWRQKSSRRSSTSWNSSATCKYEHYFLTVADIVAFARSRHILCQGRGSAANSVICYCIGVTEVDPARMSMLFERFISKERNEPPDIDIDFEHERREEVLAVPVHKVRPRPRGAHRRRHQLPARKARSAMSARRLVFRWRPSMPSPRDTSGGMARRSRRSAWRNSACRSTTCRYGSCCT